ncbi:MAG: arylesterase [Deltaproteobacteria bacterium]|nr:arylesterase [Deltaproteobacteria bacterium]
MRHRVRAIATLFVAAALAACQQATPEPPSGQAGSPRAARTTPQGPVVAFLGDSLTAGYDLPEAQAFPALLGERLAEDGIPIRVINAGVSGDTSAGGLRRLDWLLTQHPDAVVVELGANDGLRGQPVTQLEENLREVVEKARAAGAKVLLLGMRLPPSYGPLYVRQFEAVYPRVANELKVAFVPFLLEGVAGRAELTLQDGMHPNAAGHRIVAKNLVPPLRRLLER